MTRRICTDRAVSAAEEKYNAAVAAAAAAASPSNQWGWLAGKFDSSGGRTKSHTHRGQDRWNFQRWGKNFYPKLLFAHLWLSKGDRLPTSMVDLTLSYMSLLKLWFVLVRILVRIKQANQIAITICQFVIHHTVNYKILHLFISKLNLTVTIFCQSALKT